MLQNFKGSLAFTLFALLGAGFWAWTKDPSLAFVLTSVGTALVLGVLEVSLSFDNAVVNAKVLEGMNAFWRLMFLTVGIAVAVFGMRLVFPVLIVDVATPLGFMEVINLALKNPDEYAFHLHQAHTVISMFGGIFLLLVFLNWILDHEKETHWLGWIEEKLAPLGKIDNLATIVAMATVFGVSKYMVAPEQAGGALLAGMGGILTYLAVDVFGSLFEAEEVGKTVARAGIASFVYLEVLDASFSFDGVIGAFAVTKDVVLIMLGLAIGAMFVRSLTIFMVKKGTLTEYPYLEHGAHWAIGALAAIMFISTATHVPEWITGLIGAALIVLAFWSSVKENKFQEELSSADADDGDANLGI